VAVTFCILKLISSRFKRHIDCCTEGMAIPAGVMRAFVASRATVLRHFLSF